MEKRLNYTMGENKSRVPKCPPEKEKTIMAAFKHFNMIWDLQQGKVSQKVHFLSSKYYDCLTGGMCVILPLRKTIEPKAALPLLLFGGYNNLPDIMPFG